MLRVLLLTSRFAPDVGGSSRLLSDIVDHLSAAGHSVEVIAYGNVDSTAAFDRMQSYRVHRIKARRGGLSSASMLLTAVRLLLRRRFDLILAGVAYPSAILASAASHATGTPYAIYSHGEDVACVEFRSGARRLLRFALRRARLLMANSNFTLRTAVAIGAPSNSLCVHPAIDPHPYENVDAAGVERIRDSLNLRGKRVILTLARLDERKGHDNVVRALPAISEHVPDVHYLIVGHGDPARLQDLARSLHVDDRLTIVPYVPDADLPRMFALCDVFAMTSRWDPVVREVEGFGIVFLEAAACGKPTVAGNQGGCPDAVEDGVTGLIVNPESVPEIERALATILLDSGLATRMGASGRRRVRESFMRSAMLKRVEGLMLEAARR